jgi:membrane protein DedA with SNARE-associated domain
VLLTAAGSALWNTVFVFAGVLLGEAWPVVERYVDIVQYAVIGTVAIAVVWFVTRRVRAQRSDDSGRAAASAD